MAFAAPTTLQCANFAIDLKVESQYIQHLAKNTVSRAGHNISVQTDRGPRFFRDEPPYDAPLEGKIHRFCDRRQGYVLINVANNGLFSGLLIRERTGEVLAAGETVTFSQDESSYFATEQPDGLDGQQWKIYASTGTLLWSGFSFIPKDGDKDRMDAYLENPTWTSIGSGAGTFTATAHCTLSTAISWRVKLVKSSSSGQWDWAPKKRCP